ncbi:MAG: hypothetical protein ACE5IK_09380 [Acidobacteriota bacterium]
MMIRHASIPAVVIFLGLSLPAVADPALATRAREGSDGGPRRNPAPVLLRMAGRAAAYRRTVLQFTCTERWTEEDSAPWTGRPNWQRRATYRYLLQPVSDLDTVAEYRQILSRDGVPVRHSPAVVQASTPPPYLWASLLAPEFASLFRFEVVGTEKRGVTDTIIVAFDGQIAFTTGRRMAEWSGRLWVDRDLFNPIHLEAEPTRQEATMEIRLDRYRRAFRLAGIPLRSRPRVQTLSVDFLARHPSGLRFPSRSIWRRQVVNERGQRGTERRIERDFSDYGLFDIATDEIIKSLGAKEDKASPPDSP